MDKNTQTMIGSIIGIIIFAVVSLVLSNLNWNISYADQLMKGAQEINKTCPRMIDQDTQLDNVVTGPGKRFTYNYTLVNNTAESLNIERLKNHQNHSIIHSVRTNPCMEDLRKNEVYLIYSYKDKDKKNLFDIHITPDDYKN